MKIRIGGLEIGQTPEGGDTPIKILDDVGLPGAQVRTSDHQRLGRDGVMPGRDFLGTAVWSLSMETLGRYASEARDLVSQLQAVWQDSAHRGRAGRMVALDYLAGGTQEWRRVYGRPRSFDPPKPDIFMYGGFARFGAEFEVLDPRFFSGSDEGLHEHTLTHEGEVTGGWTFPVTFPLSSPRATGQRQGALTNSGSTDTPVSVTFHGPVVDPRLSSGTGWEVAWRGELLHDERLEIDPMVGVVERVRGDGSRVADFSGFSRTFDPDKVSIPPGLTNVFFSGQDDTQTSSAVVQWRDAYQSF